MERNKSEEYEQSQITTRKIFGFTFYIKHILLENIVWKKLIYTIKFYLKFEALQGI